MICMWSFLTDKLFDLKSLLVIFGDNFHNFGDLHIFIVKGAIVLLNSQSVTFTLFPDSLLHSELRDLAIFLFDVMPDHVASS